jgi:hypothetical protein
MPDANRVQNAETLRINILEKFKRAVDGSATRDPTISRESSTIGDGQMLSLAAHEKGLLAPGRNLFYLKRRYRLVSAISMNYVGDIANIYGALLTKP